MFLLVVSKCLSYVITRALPKQLFYSIQKLQKTTKNHYVRFQNLFFLSQSCLLFSLFVILSVSEVFMFFLDSKFFYFFYKGERFKFASVDQCLRTNAKSARSRATRSSLYIVRNRVAHPYNAFIGLHFTQFNLTRLKSCLKRKTS